MSLPLNGRCPLQEKTNNFEIAMSCSIKVYSSILSGSLTLLVAMGSQSERHSG